MLMAAEAVTQYATVLSCHATAGSEGPIRGLLAVLATGAI